MFIQLIQMSQQFFHHAALEWGKKAFQICQNLLFACFQIMRDFIFAIHFIILLSGKLLSVYDEIQYLPGALSIY